MASLLARMLPLAFGAAVSPTLFALEVLVLSGRQHPVARAWAVAGGSAAVLVVYCALGLTVLAHVNDRAHHSTTGAVIDLAAGVLLGLLAARTLHRHPTAAEAHHHRTADRLARASTLSFVAIGAVAMLTNFSTLVLFLPALHEITHSSVSLAGKGAAGLLLLVITLLPVLVPVALVTVLGRRADPLLARLNGFVGGHSRQISAGIEILFCAVLVWKGVGSLP